MYSSIIGRLLEMKLNFSQTKHYTIVANNSSGSFVFIAVKKIYDKKKFVL